MSSYIERLDRKETIKKAKQRMKHFSDLYLLLCAGYSLPAVSYGERYSSSSLHNHSQQLLHQIEVKDERYDEIRRVLDAMQCLEEKENEILFLRHIAMLSNVQIESVMHISESYSFKLLRNAYFSLAIVLNIEKKEQILLNK